MLTVHCSLDCIYCAQNVLHKTIWLKTTYSTYHSLLNSLLVIITNKYFEVDGSHILLGKYLMDKVTPDPS